MKGGFDGCVCGCMMDRWMKVSWIKGLIGPFRYNEIARSMNK